MFTRLGDLIGEVSDLRLYRNIAVAACVGTFSIIEYLVHQWVELSGFPKFTASLVDAGIVGTSFGFAVWALLLGNCERRSRVRQELERIAELNHEIRNALQVIAHSHFGEDSLHRSMVMGSVARIDAVLKRVIPVVGTPERNVQRR